MLEGMRNQGFTKHLADTNPWDFQAVSAIFALMNGQTIYCNEFLFLRWKGDQINGFTNPVAPSASALSLQQHLNGIISGLFKSCLLECGMLSPLPLSS